MSGSIYKLVSEIHQVKAVLAVEQRSAERLEQRSACVVGAGPNGLSAAIVLAQAGFWVDVLEAEATIGGAARTMELTLPGFLHDFGSAVYPLGAASPFFESLPLREHGLEWIRSPAPLAHPLDDGTAVVLESDLSEAAAALGPDGARWHELVYPFVKRWWDFAADVLGPLGSMPRHPLLMAQFALSGLLPAKVVAQRFQSARTRALFAGLAAHALLSLNQPLSAAFGLLMAVPAHVAGWPIPRGGAQAIAKALSNYLLTLGARIRTSFRVERLSALPNYDLIVCDVTPKQLLSMAGDRLTASYKRRLANYSYGPAVFKVDYALKNPIPWKAHECLRAATVHLGGSFEEIAASEQAVMRGKNSDQPFVLLAQPSLFDPSRAPFGQHTAWAYCHVPNGSKVDVLDKLEGQIERFAPGFRESVLARCVLTPAELETMDGNLVGGDIGGGKVSFGQLLFRPTARHYATSARDIYICSSSTPPGGGVHGMCGYHAARTALRNLQAGSR
jgi:phytoene dehydrogenase-like protein